MITKKYKKGFTVLETLVAITIFITAVTAVFGTVQLALSNASFTKHQVQAFFLAHEVVEYLRNARDTNVINGGSASWLSGFAALSTDPCSFTGPSSGKTCTIDTTLSPATAFSTCPSGSGSCASLRQNTASSYLFGYDNYNSNSSWPVSPFRREVEIRQGGTADEIAVTVNITWTKGLLTKTFTIKEAIFNWQ